MRVIHTGAPTRAFRLWPMMAIPVVLLAMAFSTACVPKDVRDPTEVGGARDLVRKPPVFPETGQVSPDLLAEGLIYDFSTNEVDLNLWVPSASESHCAAEAIVAKFAARLSDLGYEPGVDGAGLNDIALTGNERTEIAKLFEGCVDTEQMLASMFMGSGNMLSSQALCMAQGLDGTPMPGAMLKGWMFGTGLDPIGDDAALATLMLDYTKVCLPSDTFTWNGLDLPGDDPIDPNRLADGGSPSGSSDGGDTLTSPTAGGDTGGGAIVGQP